MRVEIHAYAEGRFYAWRGCSSRGARTYSGGACICRCRSGIRYRRQRARCMVYYHHQRVCREGKISRKPSCRRLMSPCLICIVEVSFAVMRKHVTCRGNGDCGVVVCRCRCIERCKGRCRLVGLFWVPNAHKAFEACGRGFRPCCCQARYRGLKVGSYSGERREIVACLLSGVRSWIKKFNLVLVGDHTG